MVGWGEIWLGWTLKIGGEIFYIDHNLQIGDILVFKHQGKSVFVVLIHDPAGCESST